MITGVITSSAIFSNPSLSLFSDDVLLVWVKNNDSAVFLAKSN